MSKKNKREGAEVVTTPFDSADEPIRDAFMIKFHSLAEWQQIDLKIQGDRVISRKEHESNLPMIVWRKLGMQLRKSQT